MPAQCPDCGRFLKKDLVESLSSGPAPCPKCEAELTAAMFGEGDAPVAEEVETPAIETPQAPAHAATVVTAEPTDAGDDGHEVAAEAPDRDPLDGWDQGTEGMLGLGGQHEREIRVALEPQQALVAGIVGALLGALLSKRTGRGALLGAIVAILAGGLARGMSEARDLR